MLVNQGFEGSFFGGCMTKVTPKYNYDVDVKLHWSEGTCGLEYYPDLEALAETIKSLKEKQKPHHFEVNGLTYTVSNKVWNELRSEKERRIWQEKIK